MEQVVYFEKTFPRLDDIPPEELNKLIEEVEKVELQYSAKKQLKKTCKF